MASPSRGNSKKQKGIAVFGSCFIDYIGYTDRIPNAGETLTSNSFAKGFGGKGANQAVMAAKLGADVRMIANVGTDGDGEETILNFRRVGVNTNYMKRVPNTSTGLAMISVDKEGRNSIVICPNAAGMTSFEDAFLNKTAPKEDPFDDSIGMLICQNEIPLAATLKALQYAHSKGIYTVFNTAPAPKPEQLEEIIPVLKYVSLFCPNEHESFILTGIKIVDIPSAEKNAEKLKSLGIRDVVITLGSEGVLVAEHGKPSQHIPAHKVKAIDTTGAGDCFVGAMAFFLAEGASLALACDKANACAAVSVTGKGTQSSYPSRSQLPAALFAPAQDVGQLSKM